MLHGHWNQPEEFTSPTITKDELSNLQKAHIPAREEAPTASNEYYMFGTEKKEEESMQSFTPGQRVKFVSPLDTFYAKYRGLVKDIVGEYTDARIESEGRVGRVKAKFLYPVEKEESVENFQIRDYVSFELGEDRIFGYVEEKTFSGPSLSQVRLTIQPVNYGGPAWIINETNVKKEDPVEKEEFKESNLSYNVSNWSNKRQRIEKHLGWLNKEAEPSPFETCTCSKECDECPVRDECDVCEDQSMTGSVYVSEEDAKDILDAMREEDSGQDDDREGIRQAYVEKDYDCLYEILMEALDQAQAGKGRSRHSNGKSFLDQPICMITREVGIGFPIGQTTKKAEESQKLYEKGNQEIAESNILGAINYLAAALIVMREES